MLTWLLTNLLTCLLTNFVVFKRGQDLGLLPDKLEKLLTAAVIISMSITPLLASLAVYLGDLVERIDASVRVRVRARARVRLRVRVRNAP